MVEPPIVIIFQILYTIIYGTANTILTMIHLFFKLLFSLSYIISISGLWGVVLSILILIPVVYIIVRVFSGGIVIILLGATLLFLIIFILLLAH